MACDAGGDVALGNSLHPPPRRHRVDLEHDELAIAVLDEIDTAIVRADGAARGDRDFAKRAIDGGRPAPPAAGDIGDPAGDVTHHRRDGGPAEVKNAKTR